MTSPLDRLSLREIEFRVAMQMSGADSTSVSRFAVAAGLIGDLAAG